MNLLQRRVLPSCHHSRLPCCPRSRLERSPTTQQRPRSHAEASSSSSSTTMVKVCGVTNAEDARMAAAAGADFIGMIMWPKAKRGVSDDTARAIATAARELGATPVGVFVDEDAETINRRCKAAGIPVAQLHGDGARSSLPGLSSELGVIWVLHATPEGQVVTPLPATTPSSSQQQPATTPSSDAGRRQADWLLIDGLQGGSGQALDWGSLQPPPAEHRPRGWLLAGGLKPENVAQAVAVARPTVVDVSSGVCGPDGLKKDAGKVVAFVQAAKSAS